LDAWDRSRDLGRLVGAIAPVATDARDRQGRDQERLGDVRDYDLTPLFPEEFPEEGRATFVEMMRELGWVDDLSDDRAMMLAIRIFEFHGRAYRGARLERERG
jgi:hypothetical protein